MQNQLTYSVIRCMVYPVKGPVELCGAGWPHPLAPSPSKMERGRGGDCSIRVEDTALEGRARSKIYTDPAWSLSVVVMHVAEAPGRSMLV